MLLSPQPCSTPPALPSDHRPTLAIAIGDPAGIGPEVVLKALAHPAIAPTCRVKLVGNWQLLHRIYGAIQSQIDQLHDQGRSPEHLADPDKFEVVDVPLEADVLEHIHPGTGNRASGEASFRFLAAAIDQALAGQAQAVVTAPIAKSAWKAAGHAYPGQTELLAERAGVERFGMMFVARSPHTDWSLRMLLATTHIPLGQVVQSLTPDLMTLKLDLLVQSLQQDFALSAPRIAISGLNPHSGELGQLGTEEQDWMIPWIREMGDRHPTAHIDGPIPPDTLWVRPAQAWYGSALHPQAHDAYVALYHDQGLIPVKLMGFDRAVNTTIGLPFVRTSPDHGTAFDIAGQGIADATSMVAAIQFAAELAERRFGRQVAPEARS
ncbi:MAG: 4-hydroxythreonine-4-phosphate dehydrogenase PdxA [Synechococcales bacterium]|nr:4-hydroxythreonine-4-phosphate dehydrogenase PdxA [Synechococcales bacterium]